MSKGQNECNRGKNTKTKNEIKKNTGKKKVDINATKKGKVTNKEEIKNNTENRKSKSKFSKIIKIMIIVILILLICAGILIGKRVKDNGGGVQGIVATILGHDQSTLENLEELRFLVLGQSQNLTDTIMVCSYNPRSQKASILSIPRDTFTGKNKNSATAYNKINALYQQSPEKLIEKINEITGLNIQYYVHIDTDGLVDLVNAIGGVEFDVPINMKYDDSSQKLHINLKAGYQKLNGEQAEQLVRFRHNNNGTTYPAEYGQEDIGRMRTQREFIKAVIKKMAKPENINKVDDYIEIANKYVTTNFNFNALKDYAPYALSFNIENIRTETLPGASEKCNGLWFYIYNKKQTTTLVEEMFSLEPVDEVTITEGENETANADEKTEANSISNVNVSGIKVEILNGTDSSANLNNIKTKLQKAGFKIAKTGTTTSTTKTTIINRTNKSEEVAKKLQNTVGAGTISNGNDNSNVDFTIVIGSDF